MDLHPIDIPLYSLGTAARWVGIPPSTLRKWIYGRTYTTSTGKTRHSRPLIVAADAKHGRLSFANIVEAHILEATRNYRISMADIRGALDLAQRDDPHAKHPLVTGRFFRRGRKIFVEYLKLKIAASRPLEGQPFLDQFDTHLDRIELDDRGKVVRLFPLRRNDNKTVVLNSGVAGGQPIVAGTGILVEQIRDLHKAGLSPSNIANQYGLDEATVVEAIKYIAA